MKAGAKPYFTRDPMVAALLTYLGYPSLRFEQVLPGEWEYVFDNTSGGIQEDVDAFNTGAAVADAKGLLTVADEYRKQMTAQSRTTGTGAARLRTRPDNSTERVYRAGGLPSKEPDGTEVETTTNQCIATTAVYLGATLMSVERIGTGHTLKFTLDMSTSHEPATLAMTDEMFYRDNASVSPKEFWNACCDVRREVRAALSGNPQRRRVRA